MHPSQMTPGQIGQERVKQLIIELSAAPTDTGPVHPGAGAQQPPMPGNGEAMAQMPEGTPPEQQAQIMHLAQWMEANPEAAVALQQAVEAEDEEAVTSIMTHYMEETGGVEAPEGQGGPAGVPQEMAAQQAGMIGPAQGMPGPQAAPMPGPQGPRLQAGVR